MNLYEVHICIPALCATYNHRHGNRPAAAAPAAAAAHLQGLEGHIRQRHTAPRRAKRAFARLSFGALPTPCRDVLSSPQLPTAAVSMPILPASDSSVWLRPPLRCGCTSRQCRVALSMQTATSPNPHSSRTASLPPLPSHVPTPVPGPQPSLPVGPRPCLRCCLLHALPLT